MSIKLWATTEAVDPIILGMKLMEVCDCCSCECGCCEIPEGVDAGFGEPLVSSGDNRRLFVTLGQFSIIRLERDAQLLIPMYDYCVPEKDCTRGGNTPCVEDPCEQFRKVQFPINRFFPGGECGGEEKRGCCGG